MRLRMTSEKQKMLAGELYDATDPELQACLARCQEWLVEYNASLSLSPAQRHPLLAARLGSIGATSEIRPPFHCDYGFNIHLGDRVFLNFNCIILDVVCVSIGDGSQFGPCVQLLSADHPRDPKIRASGLEFGRPITIGKNVWVGGGAIILPGVTIEDDAIVGAGSIVTRNVPAGVSVAGNPARALTKKKQLD
jgi:maltose O-acetyltransferase